MNERIEILLPYAPLTVTHQNKKIVRCGNYIKLANSKKLNEAITHYETLLQPYAPHSPLTGALEMRLQFVFPFPKSARKADKYEGSPKVSRPDWDNLAKTLQDCLTRLCFWQDDSQIVKAFVMKCYGEQPRITITIKGFNHESR